jgi:sporulation protein YlmC with PRC-barrel domain
VPSDTRGTGATHRLSELLGAAVVLPDGRRVGHVDDVRLAGGPGLQDYAVDGFVVGARAGGALPGYDLRGVRGPWLLRALVRRANRDTRRVPWPAVRRIDWEARVVVVDRVDPLENEHGSS